MGMSDVHNGDWRGCLTWVKLVLLVAALLLVGTPLRAESDQPLPGPAAEETGAPAGSSGPSPQPQAVPPETPPSPVPPAATPKQELPPVPAAAGAYLPSTPATAISAFGAQYTLDEASPLTVPRSGGLPSLLFENKMGNWLSATLSVAEAYDTNVYLTSAKRDDFVTRVSPAVAFKYQNQLLEWNLGTTLDYRYYAWNTRSADLSYSLTTGGRIKVYRDYAVIDFSDSFTQTSQSNAVDYASLSSSTNVTNLNTLRLNPRLELPLTSRLRFTPQYTYTNYWYPTQSQQNRQNQAVSADVSYDLSALFTPALGYSFIRMDGQLVQYNQHYPFVRITYRGDRVTLTSGIGFSMLDLDVGGSTRNLVWSVALAYRLASMTVNLATSSDVDQGAYLNSSNVSKAPQLVVRYTGSLTREFQSSSLSFSVYFNENSDSLTSNLLTRRLGTSGSLTHTLSSRISGVFSCRVERSDQWNYTATNTLSTGGIQSLLYQLAYQLSYRLGSDWSFSGSYSYTNSSSPQNGTSYNYTDNKFELSFSRAF